MQKIGPCLWFDDQAEEAAAFYCSIFPESRVLGTTTYLPGSPGPEGTVQTVRFVLDGEEFEAINGGPVYTFTPAISIIVNCADQAELDRYWERLLEGGGEPVQCGWLTDRFGLSWQVVPTELYDMISSPDIEAATRATDAMLKMIKLDLGELRRAFAGVAQGA